MNKKISVPKDAAAVILLKGDKVLWARRNPNIKFLGGWHAFPGGKIEPADSEIAVKNCADKERGKFIVALVREVFEEVGVLLARGGEKLTKGQRASLHDDLISGRSTLAEILADWNLRIDAENFFYTGFWTTPQFSPIRFKTRFFVAECPPKQQPYAAISEMEAPEFIAPEAALQRWANAEVLISPPVLIALQILADQKFKIEDAENSSAALNFESLISNLLEKSQNRNGEIDFIELNPRLVCFPLKTDTLPPATHTNCFIVGRKKFVVIDAASRETGEQRKLHNFIDSLIEKGCVCKEIIVSHSHRDHFGGENELKKHLEKKFGLSVPISAHRITGEILSEKAAIERFINDDEKIELSDENGEDFVLNVFHAPGHARGHLCFYDQNKGFLLSSDNVVGTGTVVIAPPEGIMIDYLKSLEEMKNLPNLRFLCGSHGAAASNARAKIEEYIAHRLEREKQVLQSFENGAKTPGEIAGEIYLDLKPELRELAEKSVEAHIEKLKNDGKI